MSTLKILGGSNRRITFLAAILPLDKSCQIAAVIGSMAYILSCMAWSKKLFESRKSVKIASTPVVRR